MTSAVLRHRTELFEEWTAGCTKVVKLCNRDTEKLLWRCVYLFFIGRLGIKASMTKKGKAPSLTGA